MTAKKGDESGALRQFKADLKQNTVGRLYVFYGEEPYLREFYTGELRRRLIPAGLESFNLFELEGKTLTVEHLEEAVDRLPMMCPRILILVSDYDIYKAPEDQRERLTGLFEDLPDTCCLAFLYDTLDYKPDNRMKKLRTAFSRYGQEVCFPKQGQKDLVPWIIRHCAALGKEIDPGDAEHLLFLTDGAMHSLNTEIEKIGAYTRGKRITRTDIDAVVVPALDAAVYHLTDAVLAQKYDKAAGILADLLRMQEEPIPILAAISRQARQLYTICVLRESGKNPADITTIWPRMTPWAARRLMASAHCCTAKWCRGAVILCAQTDFEMKSGGDPHELLIELLPRLRELAS